MKNIYKLSEKSGWLFSIGTIVGIFLTMIITMLYINVTLGTNDIVLAFVVYVCYIAIFSLTSYIIVKITKCRSKKSAQLFSVILSVFAAYFNLFYFTHMILERNSIVIDPFSLFSNPILIFQYLDKISTKVYDTILGIQINGWILWLIWIVETLGIVATGFIGKYYTFEQVFCESCKKWVGISDNLMLKYDNDEELDRLLESDLEELLKLTATNDFYDQHILVNLNKCKKCNSTITINIDKKIGYIHTRLGNVIGAQYQNASPVFNISSSTYEKFLQKIKECEND